MIGGVMDALHRLSPRERVLVGVLVLFLLPVALWFGVIEPLNQRREQAETDLTDARSLNLWVRQRGLEMEQLQKAGQASGPQEAIGLAALEQALIAAGLRPAVSGLSNGAEGGIDIRFETVSFTDLMAWLSAQEPVWGYDIAGFRLSQGGAPGEVRAEFHLVPQG